MAHGVTIQEQATSIVAPAQVASAIPVVVGTAPVNLSKRAKVPINEPVLVYSFAEAVAAFGYSDDFASYTLCEVMDSHFRLFGLAPVVLINVLNPADHKAAVAAADVTVTSGAAKLAVKGIVLASLSVKSADGETTYVAGTDYTAAFDSDGHVIVTRKATGSIPAIATALKISYDKLDPAAIQAADVIGGVDGATGALTGLELINQVFPRFGLVPSLILAPGYAQDPTVAAVMVAKAGNINGHFQALALTDAPTTGDEALYTGVPAWKNDNSYTSPLQVVGWPKVKLGDKQYHLSTQTAGAIGATDTAYGGIPYASPSNKALKANGAVIADGSEVFLGPDQAAFLNSQGIVTALNFVGGWKLWGNNTGAYPANTDAKDAFIPIRRMFNWIRTSIVLTYWQKVDDPTNKKLIETVTDSINYWLNGLTASGALLGGRVEFNASENPTTDLLAGIIRFHVFIAPPGPAQEMNFILEYDPSYLGSLFA